MGVGGRFWDALKPYARFEPLDFLRDKRVAVDLSFWLVQHDAAVRSRSPRARSPHLRITFFRTLNIFSKMGAYPVFVVDGEPPLLKAKARAERFFRLSGIDPAEIFSAETAPQAIQRNRVFTKCVRECVELLEHLGMPVLTARGEAEALCAQLNHEGHVDACITADSDAFLFGAKCVIKTLRSNSKEPFECYNMSDIEVGLGLKRKQMIAVALLVGNDLDSQGVFGFGVDTAIRFVKLFSENEILERLHEVGKGMIPVTADGIKASVAHDVSISDSGLAKGRSPHCSRCGHPGRRTAHSKSACSFCMRSGCGKCIEKPTVFRCECLSCEQDRETKEQKRHENWQIRMCNRIADEKSFPNNEIIQIYLGDNHGCYEEKNGPDLKWQRPNVDSLCDFLSYHQRWEPAYIRQRILPMLSTIYLREMALTSNKDILLYNQYSFDSISRVKVRYGNLYYVVKWKKTTTGISIPKHEVTIEEQASAETQLAVDQTSFEDPLDEPDVPLILLDNGCLFLLTDENMQLVQAAFPEVVNKFLEAKRLKDSLSKESKSRSNKRIVNSESPKSSGMQLSITGFYRSTKLKHDEDPGMSSQSRTLSRRKSTELDKNFPKSVRRRLLFD